RYHGDRYHATRYRRVSRRLVTEVGAAPSVAGLAGRFELPSGPTVGVIPHAASRAERDESNEHYEHDKRRQIHQCSSWNTSDLTMTGTTPLGASGVPMSM